MVELTGLIDGITNILTSENENKYFDVSLFLEENKFFVVRIMERDFDTNEEFALYRQNLFNSNSVDLVYDSNALIVPLIGEVPGVFYQNCIFNYNSIVGDFRSFRHYFNVKDVLEFSSLKTSFSVHGCIKWITQEKGGCGKTIGLTNRKCYLQDLNNKNIQIEVEVWSKHDENQFPITDLYDGFSYRFEFMRVCESRPFEKVLTNTPVTNFYPL